MTGMRDRPSQAHVRRRVSALLITVGALVLVGSGASVARAALARDAARTRWAEFEAQRAEDIVLVEGLGSADLDGFAVHDAVGRVTVRDLLHEWVFHDHNHIRQMLANAQARAWPAMGNNRCFSHPYR